MARKLAPVTLIIPDASPLLTLGRIGRLDVLSLITPPIHIVDVVSEEAQRPQNDLNGAVRRWLARRPNNVSIVETIVGEGLRSRRARGEHPVTGNLGEIAVDEYATRLALQGDPHMIPLVLFEDPDVLELRIARLRNIHLLNTAALLLGLKEVGALRDADALLAQMNGLRKTPMLPIDRPARTKRVGSSLAKSIYRKGDDDHET